MGYPSQILFINRHFHWRVSLEDKVVRIWQGIFFMKTLVVTGGNTEGIIRTLSTLRALWNSIPSTVVV